MAYQDKIKDILQLLQVEADAYKSEGDCSGVIAGYIQALIVLKDILNEMYSEEEFDKEKKCSLLKSLVPELLVGVVCHTGSHYWTNKRSRQLAKESLISLLKLCLCQSVLELLVGEIINPSITGPSPYTKVQPTTTDDHSVLLLEEHYTDQSLVESSLEISLWQPVGQSPQQPLDQPLNQPIDQPLQQLIFSHGVLKDVLPYLRDKLQRGQWKKYPNAKHTLLWCLRYLKHPHVNKYIDSFLPPLLLLLDDHEVYHKQLGLSGLSHLIRNIDTAELVQYGRANVMFEAIKGLLYFNEVDIINSLHPCLLLLLPILEGPKPRIIDTPRKPGKTDEIFSILLYTMDTESKVAVKKAYSRHVCGYIELMGIYSVRYLTRLLSIIAHYIEYPDYCGEETRRNCLKVLSCLMKYTWPRIPGHSDFILKLLVKLISDLCPDQTTIPESISDQLSLIVECLTLLIHCDTNIKITKCDSLLTSTSHRALKQCIEQAISTATCNV